MDPDAELRIPFTDEDSSLVYRADLGRGQRLDRLADVLRDLDTAVNLGERVALKTASHLGRRRLLNRAVRGGPEVLRREAEALGYEVDASALRDADYWLHREFDPRRSRSLYQTPLDLLNTLADIGVAQNPGEPVTVTQINYRNPLELVLAGSAVLLARGIIPVLRLIRDWSHTRRIGAAQAVAAESIARQASSHADLVNWLVREATQGRLHQPPQELVDLVTRPDLLALERLASQDVTLELPPGTDPGPPLNDTDPNTQEPSPG